jgi:hypothetical protein
MQQSMENVTAESAATTEMLRQLCDSLSGVKQQLTELSTQVADANSALRENRERTDALEARTEEIAQRSVPLADPASSTSRGVVFTTSPPPGQAALSTAGAAPSSAPGVIYTNNSPPGQPTPQIRVDPGRGSTSRPPSPPHLDRPYNMRAGVGSGPDGHRDTRLYRGDAPGILGIPPPSPGTGIHPLSNQNIPPDQSHGTRLEEFRGGTYFDNTRNTHNPTPKMDFPKFDGENPKLWQTQCESYFEVFRVQPCLRTRFASLNFVQEAALWLHNHEAK